MPRHAHYLPHGVIPAVLLPFTDDLAIDEKGFRKHLRDVAATDGISAITINAHSTEVASCSFEEQRRVLAITQDEIGAKLPIVNGIWADGSLEAARIARMAEEGGASALLVFPPAPFTLQQSPAMALEHFAGRIGRRVEPADHRLQYPLATGRAIPRDTLLKMVEAVPTLRAIKDPLAQRADHSVGGRSRSAPRCSAPRRRAGQAIASLFARRARRAHPRWHSCCAASRSCCSPTSPRAASSRSAPSDAHAAPASPPPLAIFTSR